MRAAPKIAGRLLALGQMSPALALLWGTRFAPAFLHSASRCASVEGERRSVTNAEAFCETTSVTKKTQKLEKKINNLF